MTTDDLLTLIERTLDGENPPYQAQDDRVQRLLDKLIVARASRDMHEHLSRIALDAMRMGDKMFALLEKAYRCNDRLHGNLAAMSTNVETISANLARLAKVPTTTSTPTDGPC